MVFEKKSLFTLKPTKFRNLDPHSNIILFQTLLKPKSFSLKLKLSKQEYHIMLLETYTNI